MSILFLIGFVILVFLIDSIVRGFNIKGRTMLSFVALLSSIAIFNMVIKERFVDKDLESMFNKELVYIQSNCAKEVKLPKNFVVQFGKTGDAIGYCQKYINGFKIVISPWYWNGYLDELGRHQLLLHEMMHCVFNVKHSEDPKHFMAPEYDYIKADELDRQVKELLKEKCF